MRDMPCTQCGLVPRRRTKPHRPAHDNRRRLIFREVAGREAPSSSWPRTGEYAGPARAIGGHRANSRALWQRDDDLHTPMPHRTKSSPKPYDWLRDVLLDIHLAQWRRAGTRRIYSS